MCADPCPERPEDTVSSCPECGNDVDSAGDTTEEICSYSPIECKKCGWQPCDESC